MLALGINVSVYLYTLKYSCHILSHCLLMLDYSIFLDVNVCIFNTITSSLNDGKTFRRLKCELFLQKWTKIKYRSLSHSLSMCVFVYTLYEIVQRYKKFLSHLFGIYSKIWKILRNGVLQIQIDLMAMVIVMVLGYHYHYSWNCQEWECVWVI